MMENFARTEEHLKHHVVRTCVIINLLCVSIIIIISMMWCHLLLPNLYTLISDGYYLRTGVCTNTELITTLHECKLAVSFLQYSGLNVIFGGLDEDYYSANPKGCVKTNEWESDVFFNTRDTSMICGMSNCGIPICKNLGE